MGHYETLGVDQTALADEIRRSYLRLARSEHPDLHNESGSTRSAAETKMQRINAAWEVLGDPDERDKYDREHRPAQVWVPATEPEQTVEFDENFDRPFTSEGLPSWLAVAPVLSVASGVVMLVGGALVGATPVMAVGIVGLVLSVVLFLMASLVALGRSRGADRLD